jgi:hypothetical protein
MIIIKHGWNYFQKLINIFGATGSLIGNVEWNYG